ncbi:hypothetical protein AMAG_01489 [Allomyces macrogynus ATCC 38327]|uniref:Uncharacterized protein n=1 Tax=Allomyces macrogynus (strain ATCC 38327) TaxID=578462 RepID=A0A0L0RZ55_ALLM3|nr:hypothetical protein AMAG_01489 [Allomyces macrogynus ATCC 38327]|eukprot:KNE55598.1 hypothetical protein AMAG_01489 [Allomyces macrogynus ATCC 38327]
MDHVSSRRSSRVSTTEMPARSSPRTPPSAGAGGVLRSGSRTVNRSSPASSAGANRRESLSFFDRMVDSAGDSLDAVSFDLAADADLLTDDDLAAHHHHHGYPPLAPAEDELSPALSNGSNPVTDDDNDFDADETISPFFFAAWAGDDDNDDEEEDSDDPSGGSAADPDRTIMPGDRRLQKFAQATPSADINGSSTRASPRLASPPSMPRTTHSPAPVPQPHPSSPFFFAAWAGDDDNDDEEEDSDDPSGGSAADPDRTIMPGDRRLQKFAQATPSADINGSSTRASPRLASPPSMPRTTHSPAPVPQPHPSSSRASQRGVPSSRPSLSSSTTLSASGGTVQSTSSAGRRMAPPSLEEIRQRLARIRSTPPPLAGMADIEDQVMHSPTYPRSRMSSVGSLTGAPMRPLSSSPRPGSSSSNGSGVMRPPSAGADDVAPANASRRTNSGSNARLPRPSSVSLAPAPALAPSSTAAPPANSALRRPTSMAGPPPASAIARPVTFAPRPSTIRPPSVMPAPSRVPVPSASAAGGSWLRAPAAGPGLGLRPPTAAPPSGLRRPGTGAPGSGLPRPAMGGQAGGQGAASGTRFQYGS